MKRFWIGMLFLITAGAVRAENPTPTKNLQRACTQPECKWLNDNFTALDGSTQQRFDAAYNGVAAGVVCNATNLSNGICFLAENNRTNPVAYDASFPFWIGMDSDTTQPSFGGEVHSDTLGTDVVFAFRKSAGSHATPAVVTAGHILGTLLWQGYDGQSGVDGWINSTQGGVAAIEAYAAETYSASAHGSSMKFFTIPTGSSTLGTALYLSPSGNAGMNAALIGSTAADPVARFQVVEPLGVGNVVAQLQSTTTNDSPTEKTVQCKVLTTDATVTNLCTFAVTSGKVLKVSANIVSRCTGGGSCATATGGGYERVMTCKNVAGTTSAVGSVATPVTQEDTAGWDATIDCDDTSDTARVRITGAGTSNISWVGTVRTMDIGS